VAVVLYTVFNITEATMTGSVGFIAIYTVGAFCRRRLPTGTWANRARATLPVAL